MTFDLTAAQALVGKIATGLAFDWPGIESDDIAQEINVYLLENWESIAKNSEGDEGRERLVRSLANREGLAYCTAERYAYQADTAEWLYTPAEIRQVLPDYFSGDAWLDAPKRPGRTETLTGDGLSIVAMDIRTAFEQLSEQDQVIIMRAYQHHERLYVTDRKRLQYAIDRLVAILNRKVSDKFNHGDHDGPGSRKAMSNATARVMTANIYERG